MDERLVKRGAAAARDAQTKLAEWALVEPGCWVRKVREWKPEEERR